MVFYIYRNTVYNLSLYDLSENVEQVIITLFIIKQVSQETTYEIIMWL